MSDKKTKRGKWAQAEREYIKDNAQTMTPEQIALKLNRPVAAIMRERERMGIGVTASDVSTTLDNSVEWKQLAKEMSQDELEYFKYRYTKLYAQFADDILPTEETQLVDLVRYEILKGRCMVEINKTEIKLRELEPLHRELAKSLAPGDREGLEDVQNLERQINGLKNSTVYKTKELNDFQQRHEKLLTGLKATRDQRVEILDKRKTSFIDVLKAIQDPEYRRKEGIRFAAAKIGAEKQKAELASYHTYMNGEVERPLLTEETCEH